jgi:hypothetical protein
MSVTRRNLIISVAMSALLVAPTFLREISASEFLDITSQPLTGSERPLFNCFLRNEINEATFGGRVYVWL